MTEIPCTAGQSMEWSDLHLDHNNPPPIFPTPKEEEEFNGEQKYAKNAGIG